MSDEWLPQLREGNRDAWEDAFRALYPAAFHAAGNPSAGLTPSEAEDVAIEALSEVVKHVGQIDSWNGLRALLVTIAARRAISHRRHLNAVKRGSGQTVSLDEISGNGAEEPPAFGMIEGMQPQDLAELGGLLDEALGGLDPEVQALLRDQALHGLSYRELAEKHRIPIGTVGVLLARGLRRVREQLQRKPRLLKELGAYLRS